MPFQVVAYKAGSVFAGGLLLWIRDIFGWSGMFNSFASIYFLCILLTKYLGLVERSSQHLKSPKKDDALPERAETKTRDIVTKIFSVQGTIYLICFVSFYKLCERAEQTFSLFMVDKKVPRTQMAFWSSIMRTFSILGSTYSGYVLSKDAVTAQSVVLKYSALRALPIMGQWAILSHWGKDPVPIPAVTLSEWNRDTVLMYSGFMCTSLTLFCAGVITTATFTLMMRLSQREAPPDIQGTHYTTLATFEVLGKLAFASVAGGFIDFFGLDIMYIVFVALAVLCVPFAHFMPEIIKNGNKQK